MNPRNSFLVQRPSTYVSDDAFVLGVFESPTEDETKVAVMLRRAVASACDVAPEKIHPSDPCGEIAGLITAIWRAVCLGILVGGPFAVPFRSSVADLVRQLHELTGEPIKLNKDKLLKVRGLFLTHEGNAVPFRNWIKDATHEILGELSRDGVALPAIGVGTTPASDSPIPSQVPGVPASSAPQGLRDKVLAWVFPSRSVAASRVAFLRQRRTVYLSNGLFVQGVFGSPSEQEVKVSVILRRIIAREGRIMPEKLHHLERLLDVEPIIPLESDWRLRGFAVQDELSALTGRRIKVAIERMTVVLSFPRSPSGELPPARTFGAWAREATGEVLQELSRIGESI